MAKAIWYSALALSIGIRWLIYAVCRVVVLVHSDAHVLAILGAVTGMYFGCAYKSAPLGGALGGLAGYVWCLVLSLRVVRLTERLAQAIKPAEDFSFF